MRKWLLYYFYFSIITGSFVYLASLYSVNLPSIIRFYVNDFLIVPIVLSICLYILRWSRGDAEYKIPFWIILYMSLFYTVIFEYLLPQTNIRYTSDIIDVVLYFVSGFLFYQLQKKYS